MKTEIDTSLNNRTEFRLTVEKKVSICCVSMDRQTDRRSDLVYDTSILNA